MRIAKTLLIILVWFSTFSKVPFVRQGDPVRIAPKVFQAQTIDNNIFLPLLILENSWSQTDQNSWPMAGANPERTSWTAEEVPGKLYPLWYRPIEAYILPRIQIIAAYDTLYISTANGLYALDADSGEQKWVYGTEMPLGNSPTVSDGVVYVGGFDRKMHAINAYTGAEIWSFKAAAGFDTNPLVINQMVYAGSRDGKFYAIYAQGGMAGQLAWEYQTQGPVHFSAAYKAGVVYFASDDGYA